MGWWLLGIGVLWLVFAGVWGFIIAGIRYPKETEQQRNERILRGEF